MTNDEILERYETAVAEMVKQQNSRKNGPMKKTVQRYETAKAAVLARMEAKEEGA